MKRMFVVISALILCSPTWAIEIMDTRTDSSFAGIADCINCKGDNGCTKITKNNVTYYEGVWEPGIDCTKYVNDTNYHATKSECRPMAPDNVYKKYRGKLIKTVWFGINGKGKRPILVPEPLNGKIYRCVATACETGYEPKDGWCQKIKPQSTPAPTTPPATEEQDKGAKQPGEKSESAEATALPHPQPNLLILVQMHNKEKRTINPQKQNQTKTKNKILISVN